MDLSVPDTQTLLTVVALLFAGFANFRRVEGATPVLACLHEYVWCN